MKKMVESSTVIEKEEKENKLNTKALGFDLLYAGFKGIGGLGLKAVMDLKIEGKENVPVRGKAILVTISKNVIRDILVVSQITGRKVHFMVSHKLMKHQIYGPIFKSLGMFRSTIDKDDTGPIDKVFEYLNEKGDLVAMTPEAKHGREIQIKSIAGIIKFAIVGDTPIIPLAIRGYKTKLLGIFPGDGLKVKVGIPIRVEKKLNREKFRTQRYELAEDILNIIDTLRTDPDF
jgi:1-acyl-sn-glycerol-3-phosphate acyltransferase